MHLNMFNGRIPIFQWSEISKLCGGTLILGNGASISISPNFAYSSLKDHAIENGLMNNDIEPLFDFFQTSDFELILRLVWQSFNVNQALNIHDTRTALVYENIKNCLIQTVRNIHPNYEYVSENLSKIAIFMLKFDFIFSLNYDLVVYWAMLYANNEIRSYSFKDYFFSGEFSTQWRNGAHRRYSKLVFYPHGNIVLARNVLGQEIKLQQDEDKNENLRDIILSNWNSGHYLPLFVSEGNSEQKIKSIRSSYYLNHVYEQVLPGRLSNWAGDLSNNTATSSPYNNVTVIYGWSLGENDVHIIKQLNKRHSLYELPNSVKVMAISIYQEGKTGQQIQDECINTINLLKRYLNQDVRIMFFDSASEGCWNN